LKVETFTKHTVAHYNMQYCTGIDIAIPSVCPKLSDSIEILPSSDSPTDVSIKSELKCVTKLKWDQYHS